MPWKTCPNCPQQNGPRTIYCKCGYAYEGTLKKFGHAVKGDNNKMALRTNTNTTVVNNVTIKNSPHAKVDISNIPVRKVSSDTLNLNPAGYFDHLLERDAQLDILLGGVHTFVQTLDQTPPIRSHLLLHGPAAGGKTSFTSAFMKMVGPEFCFQADCTTSTQAGILNELVDAATAPEFIILDEIDKADLDQFRWLLGVMDERAEIRVNNAKVGLIQKKMPSYVIATCNDIERVKRAMNGALASRFSDHVFCPRISDKAIHTSLKRYVEMVDGDERWIQPAIDFVRNVEKTDDLRRIQTVMLSGRDRLLDGSYQKILQAASNN